MKKLFVADTGTSTTGSFVKQFQVREPGTLSTNRHISSSLPLPNVGPPRRVRRVHKFKRKWTRSAMRVCSDKHLTL